MIWSLISTKSEILTAHMGNESDKKGQLWMFLKEMASRSQIVGALEILSASNQAYVFLK